MRSITNVTIFFTITISCLFQCLENDFNIKSKA
jgi:hypothetical protein